MQYRKMKIKKNIKDFIIKGVTKILHKNFIKKYYYLFKLKCRDIVH